MLSPLEARAALQLVTAAAIDSTGKLLRTVSGPPDSMRVDLQDGVHAIIGYYTDGSSALAADFYDDLRDQQEVPGRFMAEPIVADRGRKVGNAIAWATEPLLTGDGDVEGRLAEVVQLETARPYRDTIVGNRRRDPEAVGWQRVAATGCKFCQALASRGVVYREESARFASHPHCHCTAVPVFDTGRIGREANANQYEASKRRSTPASREKTRQWVASL